MVPREQREVVAFGATHISIQMILVGLIDVMSDARPAR
jgi:hypothetical protein